MLLCQAGGCLGGSIFVHNGLKFRTLKKIYWEVSKHFTSKAKIKGFYLFFRTESRLSRSLPGEMCEETISKMF